jgi:hypothetical protein
MDGPWRVGNTELARYMATGAPDLQPPWEANEAWVGTGDLRFAANRFHEDFLRAAKDATPDVMPGSPRIRKEVPLSDAMKTIAEGPASGPGASQFLDAVTAFFAFRLQSLLLKAVELKADPLGELYESPATYLELTSAGIVALREMPIYFSRTYTAKAPDTTDLWARDADKISRENSRIARDGPTALFVVSMASLLTSARTTASLLIAF